jgi:predicted RNA-binding protein with PUA-like domain
MPSMDLNYPVSTRPTLTEVKGWHLSSIFFRETLRLTADRRYWLMKSEPDCFSFADLQAAPASIAGWDGVRNFQARNYLRDELAVGDGVLFYHSGIAEPAIVGLAKVVRAGYPDPTAFDPRQPHFDPRSRPEQPTWYQVDVQALAPLPRPLTRRELQDHPLLCNMEVLRRGNRLSVQPVSAAQWRALLELFAMTDPEV